MSGTPFVLPRYIPVNSTGRPYPLCTLTFYETGTTTLVSVYTTAACTVAHANPLTSNSAGLFPAIYLKPENGSVKAVLKNAAGSTLWTEDAIPAEPNASQAVIGAALYPRTTTEIAQSVTPESYVYPPGDVRRYYDGLGDYAAAIANALKSGEVVKLVPNADHPTSAEISYTGSCVIDGQGATISPDAAHAALVIEPAASGVSTTLSADAQVNTYSITVAAVTGLAVGDLISVVSDAAWQYQPPGETMYKGGLYRIQKITSTTLTLDSPLTDNYNVPGETVTVTKLTPIQVELRNFSVEYAANSTAAVGVSVYQGSGVIENVTVRNASTQGIFLKNCYQFNVINSRVHGSNRVALGYGVSASECYDVWVRGSSFSQCRRGVDFTGDFPSRQCGAESCHADGTGLDTAGDPLTDDNSGFGSHETAENITWRNCTVAHVKNGFLLRGGNITVDGCEAFGDISQSFVALNRASNVRITNNRYSSGLRPLKTLDVVAADDDEQKMPWFVYISNPEAWDTTVGAFIHIADNHVDDLKNGFINFATTTDSDPTAITEINGLTVQNNRISMLGSTATTTVHFMDSTNDAFTLKRSYISGNVVRNEATTLTFAHADITLDSTVIIDQVTRGATSVADNATITHGHIKTPTSVIVTTSVADEWASVPAADIGATTFKVQLTKHDNSAGTTQTVYWQVAG